MMLPIVVVLIVFSTLFFSLKMVLDYRREVHLGASQDGASMGSSELKQLIREAVDESVREQLAPIIKQLETSEPRRRLTESSDASGSTD